MPRAKLGQHFLIDNVVAQRIADAVEISPGDLVVEIGPGSGSLTRFLVPTAIDACAQLVLVELDEYWASGLASQYADIDGVTVLRRDARDLNLTEMLADAGRSTYKMVGNLPYYAGTPIVRRFLESDIPPESLVVMLQREVALDMVAEPGQMSLLSLAVQTYAAGSWLFDVEPTAFQPRPKVRSAVVRLLPHGSPIVPADVRDAMFKVARVCFRGKRKQMHNSMANGLQLSVDDAKQLGKVAGIDTTRRPATLAMDEWVALAEAYIAFAALRAGR